jgi:ubiquinone/menaquinone biosynthesis C-methylase UbiE
MDFKGFYNRTAGSYDQRHDSPASIRLRRRENRLIKRYAEGKVLDIGCGTGFHMSHDGLNTTGIDISDRMLAVAKNNGFNVKKARAEQIPFSDKSFDTVFCFFAVLNMCDSSKAVKEMARVLKPGGCALLSLSSIHDKRHFKISRQKVSLKTLFTKADLVKLFRKNGLVLERFDSAFRTGRPRWGDYSRVPIRERINLWMDRFRDEKNGVVYLAAFKKI